ncbi:MAG: hypothetical protein ACOYT4_02335 [Nanoarchaeota archaeon]
MENKKQWYQVSATAAHQSNKNFIDKTIYLWCQPEKLFILYTKVPGIKHHTIYMQRAKRLDERGANQLENFITNYYLKEFKLPLKLRDIKKKGWFMYSKGLNLDNPPLFSDAD